MIFKVLYQEKSNEAPVRERTKSIYLEASSVRDVRKKLSDREIHIEFIQALDEAHLNFEKKSESFMMENV